MYGTQCSKTCGQATKTREVACMTEGAQILEDNLCDSASKPRSIMSCNLPGCGKWNAKPWTRVRLNTSWFRVESMTF